MPQDVIQFVQAPLAGHAPKLPHLRIAGIPLAVHLAAFGFVGLATGFLVGGLTFPGLEHGGGLDVELEQPLAALVDAGRLLTAVELVVDPQDRDDTQPDIAGYEARTVSKPANSTRRASDSPRTVLRKWPMWKEWCVFGCANSTMTRSPLRGHARNPARCQHLIHDAARIFGGGEVEIQIAVDGLNAMNGAAAIDRLEQARRFLGPVPQPCL